MKPMGKCKYQGETMQVSSELISMVYIWKHWVQ
jgi:hypothetical protein